MLKPKLNTLKRVLSGVMAAVMCLGLLPAVNNANALEEVTDTSTLYIQTVDNMTGGALAGVRVKVECTTAGQYKDYGTLTSDVGGRIAINNAPVGFYRVTGVSIQPLRLYIFRRAQAQPRSLPWLLMLNTL